MIKIQIKKLDIIIIVFMLITASTLLIYVQSNGITRKSDNLQVEITLNGQLYDKLLMPDISRELIISADDGTNTLLLEPDGVSIISADCSSKSCVRTGKIRHSGEIIACLPHRLLIKLTGTSVLKDDIDGIVH